MSYYIKRHLYALRRDSGLSSGISQPNENRNSADTFRISFSSAISTSSPESSPGDVPLSIVFMCGEGIEDDLLDGGMSRIGESFSRKDAFLPKVLESASALDAQHIACGSRHSVLITRQGQLFSWGDGSGGKLGHGSESDLCNPTLINAFGGLNIVSAGCGEYHTCAVTLTGDLYTWGDGINNYGLLGHGTERSYWTPRKVRGRWKASADLFESPSCSNSLTGKLFTWGNGDEGQLGHGDKQCQLVPHFVATPNDKIFCEVACGHSITVALTICGQVYKMGSTNCGENRFNGDTHTWPVRIEGKLENCFVKEISCGSHHVVALTSNSEVFTWGKGRNGQLGHGDNADRNSPTLVKALAGKQVKRVICGSNLTAAICLNQWVCAVDYSICAGCRNPFNFKRKRHNCYNCGLFFCKACTNKKSLSASLAPNPNKLYRVCGDCFTKLNNGLGSTVNSRPPKSRSLLCVRGGVPSNEIKNEPSRGKKHGVLSRLSSFDSFRRSSRQLPESNQKLDSSSTHNSSFHGGNLRCSRSVVSSPSRSMFDSCERINASHTGSKTHSTTSPVSTKSSPPSPLFPSSFCSVPYCEKVIDDSEVTNDDLSEEISFLREQVEVLTRKSQFLTAELDRTSNQLNEATAWFQVESKKNNAAKEAIKCLMSQPVDQLDAHVKHGEYIIGDSFHKYIEILLAAETKSSYIHLSENSPDFVLNELFSRYTYLFKQLLSTPMLPNVFVCVHALSFLILVRTETATVFFLVRRALQQRNAQLQRPGGFLLEIDFFCVSFHHNEILLFIFARNGNGDGALEGKLNAYMKFD
ncbi:hypothetical protein DH2020_019453 [Rehmannia glutinosa]|uniref:FYVE-type domain-containing protein n=1 Tax=Rehmannia glutinosa TaxID=99300 RepID=A0ABR0WNN1_REHGL